MYPLEPEDTSAWDDAVMQRTECLSESGKDVINALYTVQERLDRLGIKFDIITELDDVLERIAMRQLADEMREAQEDAAIEHAISRQESACEF